MSFQFLVGGTLGSMEVGPPWENPGNAIVYCRESGPPVKIS